MERQPGSTFNDDEHYFISKYSSRISNISGGIESFVAKARFVFQSSAFEYYIEYAKKSFSRRNGPDEVPTLKLRNPCMHGLL